MIITIIFFIYIHYSIWAPHFSSITIFLWDEPLLDVQMSFRVAGARDCAPCQKWAKTWGFCSISKNDSRRGTFEEDLHRCIFRRRCSTRDMFIRPVRTLGGPGADFLRGVAFWSIRSSVLLRWFCVTGAAIRMTWHHFFVAGALL